MTGDFTPLPEPDIDAVFEHSRLSLRDLMQETSAGLASRPARTALTALGTVLGVAALVATLGLARTAGNQIVSRLDELSATEVVVTSATDGFGFGGNRQSSAIPWDAEERLMRLNGVAAAGTLSNVDIGGALTPSVLVIDPTGATEFQISVQAGSGGLFDAVRADLVTGTFFNDVHNERASSVAVLGPGAAQRLSVTRVDNQPAIFIGDVAVVVIGILADVRREPGLLNAIIVPDGFARERFDLQAPATVQIDTNIGAAQLIGEQAPVALTPNNPDLLRVRIPPDPASLRERVGDDVNALFLVLGGVSLLVGATGIANATLVSVLERTGEIGLRRALGATRRHVAVQFLTESALLGLVASVIGTSLGVLAVVAVSAVRSWEPVLQPWLPLVTPLLGVAIGLLAGAYPAWRAASVEPISALRGAKA